MMVLDPPDTTITGEPAGDTVVRDTVTVPVETVFETKVRLLEARMAEVCGHLNVLHGELAGLVATAVTDGLWEQWGIRSPEHWLAWQTGLSPTRAHQLVATAARANDLPVTFAAFAAGELSIDQVTVVARHTPTHNDAEVCELARHATVSQLRHALAKYARTEPAADEPPVEPGSSNDPRDACTGGFDDHGRYRLNADTNAVNGAIIDQALSEARDHLFHAGTPEVTLLDALVEVCRRALNQTTSVARHDRFRTYLHLDTDHPDGPAHAWLNSGPQLPASLRDLLLCDGVVRPLWHTGGQPVNVGRARRIVPDHTRRLILDRDRTCRHPTCTTTHHLEVHHLHHWLHGGPTDLPNLLALCPKHHDTHHRGVFTITGNPNEPGGLHFHDHRGRPIPPCGHPTPPTGPAPAPPPGHRYQHPTGDTFHHKWFQLTDPPMGPET